MRAALLVDGEMEMSLVAGVALGYGLGHGIAPRLKTGEAQAAVFVGGLCLCRAGLRGERERDPGERPAVLVALEYLHRALAVSVVEQLDRPVGRDLFDRHMGGGAAVPDEVARGSGYLLHIVLAVGQLLEHLHAAYGPEGVDQLVPAAVNAVQLVNAAVDEVFILLPLAVFSEGERADAAVRLVMHVDGRGSAVVLTVTGGDDRHGIVLRFFDNDGDVSVRHITAVGVDGLAEGVGVHALVEVVRPEEERILAPGAHGRGADEARSVIKLEPRALADIRAARPVFVYGELGRAADIDPVADDVGRLRAVGESVKVYPDGEVDVVVALRYDPVAVLDDVYLLSVRLEPEVVAVGGYGVRVEHEAVLHHVENKKLAVPYAAAQAHLREVYAEGDGGVLIAEVDDSDGIAAVYDALADKEALILAPHDGGACAVPVLTVYHESRGIRDVVRAAREDTEIAYLDVDEPALRPLGYLVAAEAHVKAGLRVTRYRERSELRMSAAVGPCLAVDDDPDKLRRGAGIALRVADCEVSGGEIIENGYAAAVVVVYAHGEGIADWLGLVAYDLIVVYAVLGGLDVAPDVLSEIGVLLREILAGAGPHAHVDGVEG